MHVSDTELQDGVAIETPIVGRFSPHELTRSLTLTTCWSTRPTFWSRLEASEGVFGPSDGADSMHIKTSWRR